jgi:hypothetical protein
VWGRLSTVQARCETWPSPATARISVFDSDLLQSVNRSGVWQRKKMSGVRKALGTIWKITSLRIERISAQELWRSQ